MVLNTSNSSMGESRKAVKSVGGGSGNNGGGAPNWTGNRGISADGGGKIRIL